MAEKKKTKKDMFEDLPSRNLFPDDVYITLKPVSAITLREIFRKSLFQTSKKVKRLKVRHEMSGNRFIELHGYANITDQDLFFAVHYFARTHTKLYKTEAGSIYDFCVVVPRKELLTFMGKPVSQKSYVNNMLDRSLTRLQGLVVKHNIFPDCIANFSFFTECGYNKKMKVYYFAISQPYNNILQNSNELKSFIMPDYFRLTDSLAKILDPVLRVHMEGDNVPVKKLKLGTILKMANKYDWIEKSNNTDYFCNSIKNTFMKAVEELKKKNRFKIELLKGNRYDLDSIWKVERLYVTDKDKKLKS